MALRCPTFAVLSFGQLSPSDSPFTTVLLFHAQRLSHFLDPTGPLPAPEAVPLLPEAVYPLAQIRPMSWTASPGLAPLFSTSQAVVFPG